MKRLRYALKAFWAIITSKPHVFCDSDIHSINGSAAEVESMIQHSVNLYNYVVEQENILDEVKNILNHED